MNQSPEVNLFLTLKLELDSAKKNFKNSTTKEQQDYYKNIIERNGKLIGEFERILNDLITK